MEPDRELNRSVASGHGPARGRAARAGHIALMAPALALAAWGLATCGSTPPSPVQDAMAATFEVHPNGALVSIHAGSVSWARVRVENESGAAVTMVGPVTLAAERGNTGVAEIEGLAPDTAYRYVVELEQGGALGPYRFRTAPAPDADVDVHLIYSADIDLGAEFESPIFESMAGSGASFFLSLGDWPYADNPPAAYTVDQFRFHHRNVRGAGKVQALLRAMPVYAIYDDHEARNNWDGRFRVEEAERIQAAVQVWDEWFPLHATVRGEDRRYRAWRWGRHAELFMLDTRCCRSANEAADGPDKTMLGAEQKQWLIDGLAASDASFKLVITSVALTGFGVDTWSSFVHEREEILNELGRRGTSGVLFLTADGHRFAARQLPAWGVREFMVGPLARHPAPLDEPRPEIIAQAMGYNYGEIRISAGNADSAPRLELRCLDASGELLYQESFRAGDLTLTAP